MFKKSNLILIFVLSMIMLAASLPNPCSSWNPTLTVTSGTNSATISGPTVNWAIARQVGLSWLFWNNSGSSWTSTLSLNCRILGGNSATITGLLESTQYRVKAINMSNWPVTCTETGSATTFETSGIHKPIHLAADSTITYQKSRLGFGAFVFDLGDTNDLTEPQGSDSSNTTDNFATCFRKIDSIFAVTFMKGDSVEDECYEVGEPDLIRSESTWVCGETCWVVGSFDYNPEWLDTLNCECDDTIWCPDSSIYGCGPDTTYNSFINFITSDSISDTIAYDNYCLCGSGPITGIRWWGTNVGGLWPDTFTILFINGDDTTCIYSVVPDTVRLGVIYTDTSWQFSAELSPTCSVSNCGYISIYSTETDGSKFRWARTLQAGNFGYITGDSNIVYDDFYNLSFCLFGIDTFNYADSSSYFDCPYTSIFSQPPDDSLFRNPDSLHTYYDDYTVDDSIYIVTWWGYIDESSCPTDWPDTCVSDIKFYMSFWHDGVAPDYRADTPYRVYNSNSSTTTVTNTDSITVDGDSIFRYEMVLEVPCTLSVGWIGIFTPECCGWRWLPTFGENDTILGYDYIPGDLIERTGYDLSFCLSAFHTDTIVPCVTCGWEYRFILGYWREYDYAGTTIVIDTVCIEYDSGVGGDTICGYTGDSRNGICGYIYSIDFDPLENTDIIPDDISIYSDPSRTLNAGLFENNIPISTHWYPLYLTDIGLARDFVILKDNSFSPTTHDTLGFLAFDDSISICINDTFWVGDSIADSVIIVMIDCFTSGIDQYNYDTCVSWRIDTFVNYYTNITSYRDSFSLIIPLIDTCDCIVDDCIHTLYCSYLVEEVYTFGRADHWGTDGLQKLIDDDDLTRGCTNIHVKIAPGDYDTLYIEDCWNSITLQGTSKEGTHIRKIISCADTIVLQNLTVDTVITPNYVRVEDCIIDQAAAVTYVSINSTTDMLYKGMCNDPIDTGYVYLQDSRLHSLNSAVWGSLNWWYIHNCDCGCTSIIGTGTTTQILYAYESYIGEIQVACIAFFDDATIRGDISALVDVYYTDFDYGEDDEYSLLDSLNQRIFSRTHILTSEVNKIIAGSKLTSGTGVSVYTEEYDTLTREDSLYLMSSYNVTIASNKGNYIESPLDDLKEHNFTSHGVNDNVHNNWLHNTDFDQWFMYFETSKVITDPIDWYSGILGTGVDLNITTDTKAIGYLKPLAAYFVNVTNASNDYNYLAQQLAPMSLAQNDTFILSFIPIIGTKTHSLVGRYAISDTTFYYDMDTTVDTTVHKNYNIDIMKDSWVTPKIIWDTTLSVNEWNKRRYYIRGVLDSSVSIDDTLLFLRFEESNHYGDHGDDLPDTMHGIDCIQLSTGPLVRKYELRYPFREDTTADRALRYYPVWDSTADVDTAWLWRNPYNYLEQDVSAFLDYQYCTPSDTGLTFFRFPNLTEIDTIPLPLYHWKIIALDTLTDSIPIAHYEGFHWTGGTLIVSGTDSFYDCTDPANPCSINYWMECGDSAFFNTGVWGGILADFDTMYYQICDAVTAFTAGDTIHIDSLGFTVVCTTLSTCGEITMCNDTLYIDTTHTPTLWHLDTTVGYIPNSNDDVLMTNDLWGLTRLNSESYMYGDLNGDSIHTHINWGIESTTGKDGFTYDCITVSGGRSNVAEAPYSTISGGRENNVSSKYSAIGGGSNNTISVYSIYSVIPGGENNTIIIPSSVEVQGNTISGGTENSISDGEWTTVGGGRDNNTYSIYSTISGGRYNLVDTNSTYATISGGDSNHVIGDYSTISGGRRNLILNDILGSCDYTGIGSGDSNRILSTGGNSNYCGIFTGYSNTIVSSIQTGNVPYSVIGGGRKNYISSMYGRNGVFSGDSNYVTGNYSVIAGGNANGLISADYCIISGGYGNNISASDYSSIVGGRNNDISIYSEYTSILSGYDNSIVGTLGNTSDYSVILGGYISSIDSSEYSIVFGNDVDLVDQDYTIAFYDSLARGKMGISCAEDQIHSTITDYGSFAAHIVFLPDTTDADFTEYTLSDTNYTIIVEYTDDSIHFNLPDISTCKGRIYNIGMADYTPCGEPAPTIRVIGYNVTDTVVCEEGSYLFPYYSNPGYDATIVLMITIQSNGIGRWYIISEHTVRYGI